VISVHIIPDTRQDNQPDQIKLFALQVFVDSSINLRYVPIHRLDNLELVPGDWQRYILSQRKMLYQMGLWSSGMTSS
jgi:hypothetical protein